MDAVTLTVTRALRDPAGDVRTYDDDFGIFFSRLNGEYQAAFGNDFLARDEFSRISFEGTVLRRLQSRLAYMYGRGDSLDDLTNRLVDDLPFIEERTVSRRQRWADFKNQPLNRQIGYVQPYERGEGMSYLALAWLLLPEQASVRRLALQLNTAFESRL